MTMDERLHWTDRLSGRDSLANDIDLGEETREEIFVTSYPRSGNTWLNRLLADLLRSPLQNEPKMTSVWFGPRRDGQHVIRKVHRRGYEKLQRGRWVLIQRDPRDVMVSAYHYTRSPSLLHTISIALCRCGDETMGVYERWLRSWLDHPGLADACTRYEWLHQDPVGELARIVPQLTGMELDRQWIGECVERQRFDRVRAQGGDSHAMRKGVVGDWRKHLTQAEGHLVHDSLGSFMRQQGYIESDDWWRSLPLRRG